MKIDFKAPILSFVLAVAASLAAADTTPYAGQETRDIASLSQGDIDDLLAGRGWGFAKAAELNGYPGPSHVLELADTLELSDVQRAEVQAIFDAMNAQARALGAEYVAAEAALDDAFESKAVTPEQLAALTRDAGALRAELRAVHLAAHLRTTPILSRHQTVLYNRERGYAAGDNHSGHGGH